MKPKYKSMIFVENKAGLSARKLRKMKAVATGFIRHIEGALELPKRTLIDWILTTEIAKGIPCMYVKVDWYRIQRPRPGPFAHSSGYRNVFGLEDSVLRSCDSYGDVWFDNPGLPRERLLEAAIDKVRR